MSKKNVIEQMIGLLRTPIAQRKGINIPSDECLIWASELEKELKSLISNSNEVQKSADKIEPKFKVGDKIYLKPEHRMPDDDTPIADTIHEIIAIDDKHYRFKGSFIFIEDQDKFELVEQKTADKVEPKFQNGQWVVWQNKCYKVNYNGCGYELIDQNGLRTSLEYGTIDKSAHLWSIKDARDGDVLATDSWLYIFKYTNNKALIQFHCTCPMNGRPYKWCFSYDSYLDIYVDANIHPATKEQRDLILQKMHKAGYTFDFEKKELKKIVLI